MNSSHSTFFSKVKALLRLQLARMCAAFLPMAAAALMLFFCSCGLLAILVNHVSASDTKVRIGIVGSTEGTYLGFGLDAVRALDSSRFTLELTDCTDETSALADLESGALDACIIVPDNFIASLVSGENTPLTFVMSSSETGLSARLVRELADAVSGCITESEAGIYAMQQIWAETGADDPEGNETDLNLSYIQLILSRSSLFDVKAAGYGSSVSYGSYYICAMILFFMLVLGTAGCRILIRRDLSTEKMLCAAGFSSALQTFCGFISYYLLNLALFLLLYLITILICAVFPAAGSLAVICGFPASAGGLIRFALCCLPVSLCCSALSFLFSSAASDPLTGMLLHFLGACGLGYLSGCFYPVSFFPETLQTFSRLLPTGRCLALLTGSISGRAVGSGILILLLWSLLFILVAGYITQIKKEYAS